MNRVLEDSCRIGESKICKERRIIPFGRFAADGLGGV